MPSKINAIGDAPFTLIVSTFQTQSQILASIVVPSLNVITTPSNNIVPSNFAIVPSDATNTSIPSTSLPQALSPGYTHYTDPPPTTLTTPSTETLDSLAQHIIFFSFCSYCTIY
jgi:hypothetical protein